MKIFTLIATLALAGLTLGCKSDRPYGTPDDPSPYSQLDRETPTDPATPGVLAQAARR